MNDPSESFGFPQSAGGSWEPPSGGGSWGGDSSGLALADPSTLHGEPWPMDDTYDPSEWEFGAPKIPNGWLAEPKDPGGGAGVIGGGEEMGTLEYTVPSSGEGACCGSCASGGECEGGGSDASGAGEGACCFSCAAGGECEGSCGTCGKGSGDESGKGDWGSRAYRDSLESSRTPGGGLGDPAVMMRSYGEPRDPRIPRMGTPNGLVGWGSGWGEPLPPLSSFATPIEFAAWILARLGANPHPQDVMTLTVRVMYEAVTRDSVAAEIDWWRLFDGWLCSTLIELWTSVLLKLGLYGAAFSHCYSHCLIVMECPDGEEWSVFQGVAMEVYQMGGCGCWSVWRWD